MEYEKIMSILTKEAQKLQDVHFATEWEQIATKFVTLQNKYCISVNDVHSIIYQNINHNLIRLLPKNPLEAFMMGRVVTNTYYVTDNWLSLDGYCNPVTAANTTLIDNFIFLEDIARWLADLEEDEQEELLKDFREVTKC